MRIPLVVVTVSIQHAAVGRRVHLVRVAADGRETARYQGFAQSLRRDREICGDAEAAEALAEDAPSVDAELAPYPFGVPHDRVGSEVFEVIHLLSWSKSGQRSDRCRTSGATLVQHQNAEVSQSAVEPARVGWIARRAGRFIAGTTLEEDEERAIPSFGIAHLTCEDGDARAVKIRVIEGNGELVLGDGEPV